MSPISNQRTIYFMKNGSGGIKIVAQNRRAKFDYQFIDTYEAGLVLKGTEIKSIRLAGKVSLQNSYVSVRNGELWLVEANIAEYAHGNRDNHEAKRARKLLLHRREIEKVITSLTQNGLTCVPVKMYLKKGRAKLEIAVARGKKQYDKRQDLAKKDANRAIQRELKRSRY